jgi:hypothetical protein
VNLEENSPKEGIEGITRKSDEKDWRFSCKPQGMYRLYRSKRKGDGREDEVEKC